MRYEVETQPERPKDPPSISCPDDVHRLLGPEMAQLAQVTCPPRTGPVINS